jgi:hypothetical protein
MEFILIPVAFIAVLVAVLMWLRRGQSSIGGESGDTTYEARRKAQDKGDGTRPRSMTRRAIAERRGHPNGPIGAQDVMPSGVRVG